MRVTFQKTKPIDPFTQQLYDCHNQGVKIEQFLKFVTTLILISSRLHNTHERLNNSHIVKEQSWVWHAKLFSRPFWFPTSFSSNTSNDSKKAETEKKSSNFSLHFVVALNSVESSIAPNI